MMEGFWPLLLAFLAYITSIAFIRRKHPKNNLPPGPKPWPVIGNWNLVGSIPHQSLHVLSQKYGQIMHLKLGQFPVVVASTPEMAKLFLRTHDSIFASRPALSAGKYASYNYSDVVWAPYGPYWRLTRKIYISEVFSAKKMESESFKRIRDEERRDFISRMHALSGKPILLRGHLFRYALSTINRMVLGQKYFSEGENDNSVVELDEIQEMLGEWFFLSGVFNIGDWIPWINFLDVQGYVKRMKLLNKKLDRVFEFVVNDHLNGRAAENSDTVDTLLKMAEDSNLDVKLTRDCVKALMQNLLVGGADTTPASVEWIIHELMRNPPIYKKAKDELNNVIGRNRWIEEDDFSQLPYINAIILEAMRIHPLATFLAPHCAMMDCQVAGYDIPKGTTILINTWSIGRDPDSWDMPNEFIPERFIGKQIDVRGANFALLPFGAGRRRCPGYNLALKSIQVVIANLLHGFDLKLEDGMRPEDVSMEEVYGLTTHPKEPLTIILEPVLPTHLY